jgi:L-lactate dehydrogenase complex protein LldG
MSVSGTGTENIKKRREMKDGKEEFITYLANCLGRDTVPDGPTPLVVPHSVHHDYLQGAGMHELKEIFIKNAEASGTTVYQCGAEEINQTIVQAVAAFGNGTLLVAEQDFFRAHETVAYLQNRFAGVKIWDHTLTREANIANAEQTSIGITMAELGLAESGTVMLFSQPGCGRSVSLLPRYTITVVLEKDLRPRLTQAMSYLRERIAAGLPASVNFISGASSTADIELIRVQGVHGPVAISYIIVG